MTETLEYQQVGRGHVWFDEIDTHREVVDATVTTPPGQQGQLAGELVEDLPRGLVDAYAYRACLHAQVREVDPGVWVASVVGVDGAYSDADSREVALADLHEVIVGWVAVRRRLSLEIPPFEGLDLNVSLARAARP